MLTPKNSYNGAQFDYENEGCRASGDFRFNAGSLKTVNITGTIAKDGVSYTFSAVREEFGNVNIYGASSAIIKEAAIEVAAIIDEIGELNAGEE